ncbi:MAG: SecE/Sec61-gamma subunit of protein translocation complex [Thermoleophilia bacterium]|nr:SecE/Sec61-gamma subunit of protein translocation complex [Thermoleophilia bacterium]
MAKAASSGGSGPGNRPVPPAGSRTGARRFVRESWGELRKVQWPTRQQVAQGTLVVGVVTAVFAGYISIVDQVAVRLVKQLNDFLG